MLEEATKQGFKWCSGHEPLEYKKALQENDFDFCFEKRIFCDTTDCISYKEYKAMSEFTKADLKPCMVVVLKDGSVNIVTQYKNDIALIDYNDKWDGLNRYSDDLHCKGNDNYDVVQIYGFSEYICDSMKISTIDRPLLWKSKEEPQTEEMTISQICKALGKNIKIVKE